MSKTKSVFSIAVAALLEIMLGLVVVLHGPGKILGRQQIGIALFCNSKGLIDATEQAVIVSNAAGLGSARGNQEGHEKQGE